MCTRLHSWGRLRTPPGASTDTPTQKHPGNGLPPASPILEGQWNSCSQWGFQSHPFRCSSLVPSGLKGAGPQDEGHCPSGLRHLMTGHTRAPGKPTEDGGPGGDPAQPQGLAVLRPPCQGHHSLSLFTQQHHLLSPAFPSVLGEPWGSCAPRVCSQTHLLVCFSVLSLSVSHCFSSLSPCVSSHCLCLPHSLPLSPFHCSLLSSLPLLCFICSVSPSPLLCLQHGEVVREHLQAQTWLGQ